MAVVVLILGLGLSNLFMTMAWYWHLKGLSAKHWMIAVFVSWGIAFLEYLIAVPSNRIGFTSLNMSQMKIIQEVVTLAVFAPVAVLVLKEKLSMNYLYAAICIVCAVYFIMRDGFKTGM